MIRRGQSASRDAAPGPFVFCPAEIRPPGSGCCHSAAFLCRFSSLRAFRFLHNLLFGRMNAPPGKSRPFGVRRSPVWHGFCLFMVNCGSATAVRFLHLFKFGLVVLEGATPSEAAGSREDSLLFFLRPAACGARKKPPRGSGRLGVCGVAPRLFGLLADVGEDAAVHVEDVAVDEILKWGVTLLLCLTMRPVQSRWLLRMRWQISRGLFGE